MSMKMKFGSKDIPFVYKGDKLIYPNPIKDGLLLWYDFKGMSNTDTNKEVAKDLSGNGNDGTLQNFNYSTSDFNLPDLYKNTRLIVKDPSDPIYSDYPNPPVGAVFNNYNPVSNKIVRGNIDMPALVNTLVANMKLYRLHNDSVFLENAKIIGAYISSLMRRFSFYGADTWVVPNRVSLIDGEWTPLYGEINTRSLLQAIYALSEVLKETGLYGSEVYQLTQTIGLMHNNIKSRVTEGELRAAMNGAVYEYIYTNEDTGTLVFSWGEFGISSSDMIAKAINSYVESIGEDVIYDSQGTEFTPQQILDGAAEHIKAVYDSGVLTMEPTGLPYSFLQANSESETGVNWDWVDTQERGDTWFTNDTTLWIIEGISRLSQLTEIEGLYNIAKTYRDNFLALRELNHDSYDDKGDTKVIFYDRYNFDGSHLTDDVSISISGTALLWEVDEILGIKDGVLHSRMRDTLEAHIITGKNSDINGAFGWDANDATSFVEMKATGEIYSSPFIQVGSSVSSGYKDNTLVFDGVDDKLVIPELVLDETAMSVVHDGKLYAYEDDKVLTVGEDGEIVGSRRNLLLSSNTPQSASEYELANYTYTEKLVEGEPFTATIKVKLGDGVLYPRFYNAGGNSSGAFGVPKKTHEFADGSTIWRLSDNWKISNANDFLRIYQVVNGDVYPLSTVEWCKLERGTIETPYVSASSDYKSTSLSPNSITDLQLYNKPLLKDELLHNAESKGLKQLKPGVVVQDGLVLHYDFSHESNTSEYKDKAFDYSGNGNHGKLYNFNFTEESGYIEEGLKFDGIDDEIRVDAITNASTKDIKTWTFDVSIDLKNIESRGSIFNIPCNPDRLSIKVSGGNVTIGRYTNGYWSGRKTPLLNKGLNNVTLLVKSLSNTASPDTSFELDLYVNGVKTDHLYASSSEYYANIANYLILGYQNTVASNGEFAFLDEKILSAKIYNRLLFPEEVAHNYAIEKERFNITEGEM